MEINESHFGDNKKYYQNDLIFPDYVHKNIKFPDFPYLEQAVLKYHDFPDFPWPVGTCN